MVESKHRLIKQSQSWLELTRAAGEHCASLAGVTSVRVWYHNSIH